jgi:hypothetical protein
MNCLLLRYCLLLRQGRVPHRGVLLPLLPAPVKHLHYCLPLPVARGYPVLLRLPPVG